MSEHGSPADVGPSEPMRSRFGGNGTAQSLTDNRVPRSSRRAQKPVHPISTLRDRLPDGWGDGHPDTMEAVGRLAGRVAHHLNNTLTVVDCNASFVEDALEGENGDRRLAAELREIREACGVAARLAARLLSISGRRWSEPRDVDLRTLVSEMNLRGRFGADLVLRTDFPAEACPVRVDPAQLTEAVLELVLNAREAVGSRGTVRIGVGNVVCRDADDGALERRVWLEVSDTGRGMDAWTLERAFHPFFSTHPFSADRGLGLTVARTIMRENGGGMNLSSSPGRGTTARMWLPTARSDSLREGRP
jgi:signal transduction histidine kinase